MTARGQGPRSVQHSPPGGAAIPSTLVRLSVGVACALLGILVEIGLDEVVVVAPWLIVAFAVGVLAAVLGGFLGGVAALAIGLGAQALAIPMWEPAINQVAGGGWPFQVAAATAALGTGLWLRSLILHPRPLPSILRPSALVVGAGSSGSGDDAAPKAADPDHAALAAAVREIGTGRTPVQIADALARHATALGRARGAVTYLGRDGSDDLAALARYGAVDGAPDQLPARGRQTRSDEPAPPGPERDWDDHAIRSGSNAIGVLRLSGGPSAGGSVANPLVDILVQIAADALERARLQNARRAAESEASVAAGRLGILARLAAELVGGSTIDDVARTLVDLAVDDLGAGFAVVHVADPDTGGWTLVHARGYPEGLVARERAVAPDSRVPVTAAATDRAVVEVQGEDGWRAAFPTASNVPSITGSRVIAAIPLEAAASVHGVLTIGWRSASDRARVDPDLLATAAGQGAQALERAILHAHDEDARRFQEAFIGVVSHELRTPITTILAGSRLLRRRLADDPQSAELSDDIAIEADRLTRIVDDLLVLSRLERRHLTIGDEPVHLDHLIARIVRSEAVRWPSHRIEIVPSVGSHVALGDETYVEQVLRNLLSNAAKYSPAGSLVEIAVDDSVASEIRVRVLDRGPGVEPTEIDELFSLFYRSPRTAANAAGAGIGLFVSRRLVSEMGGRMWAKPRTDGGSEFGFSLGAYPIDDSEHDGASVASSASRV